MEFLDVRSLILKSFTEDDKWMAWASINVVPPRDPNGIILGYPDQYIEYKDAVIKYEISLGFKHPELHDPLQSFAYGGMK